MTDQRDDPTYPPPASPEVRQTQLVGVVAHLVSVVVAVVLVPIAYVLLDYALRDAQIMISRSFGEEAFPPRVWVSVCAASGLLVIAAGIGRLSGLGPLVAGLLWGAVPTIVELLWPLRIAQEVYRLPDLYEVIGTTLAGFGLFVYPVAGALLIGSGLGGRWLRSR